MTLLWPYLSAIYHWFGYWAYITYRHNLWRISRTLVVWPLQRYSFSKNGSCSDLWVLYDIFAVGALLEIFKPTRQYSNSVWILDYSCCWSIQIVDCLCYVAVLFQLLSCMLIFLLYFSLRYKQCIFIPNYLSYLPYCSLCWPMRTACLQRLAVLTKKHVYIFLTLCFPHVILVVRFKVMHEGTS